MTTSVFAPSHSPFAALFRMAYTVVLRLARFLHDLYGEIELARNGGLTVRGTFYPFPERFAGTDHAEAFRGVANYLSWSFPAVMTIDQLRRTYGPAIPLAVWDEVVTWFDEQHLLEVGRRYGGPDGVDRFPRLNA